MAIHVDESDIAREPRHVLDASGERRDPQVGVRSENCPRCGGKLRTLYFEPSCVQCGFANYAHTPEASVTVRKSLFTAGTRQVLRYVGDSPSLADTLTHIRLERVRNRAVYGVECPFCQGPMAQ